MFERPSINKFCADKWAERLKNVREAQDIPILATSDMHDEIVMKMLQATCKTLDISLQQAADAFGEYWVCNFSQKIYGVFYRKYRNAREFLSRNGQGACGHDYIAERLDPASLRL